MGSNSTFREIQELIMEPPDVTKMNAQNCYLKDEFKNLSTKENGACEKFIFNDSIMKSTIGIVFDFLFGYFSTYTALSLNRVIFIRKYPEKLPNTA